MEKVEPSCIAGGNVKQCSCCGKQFDVTQQIKLGLLGDPAIPLLSMYTEELKTGNETHTSTHLFRAALFSIAKGEHISING